MIATWKYTLPAFLVPFAFVLTPNGAALIGQAAFGTIVLATLVSAVRWPRSRWSPAAG